MDYETLVSINELKGYRITQMLEMVLLGMQALLFWKLRALTYALRKCCLHSITQLFLVHSIDLLSSTCHVTAGNQRVTGVQEHADQVQPPLMTSCIPYFIRIGWNFLAV